MTAKIHFKKKLFIAILLILSLFGIFLFFAIKIVNGRNYLESDFFTFWLSGHMVWTGQNPYSAQDWVGGHGQFGVTWIPNDRFVYPLPLAFFYAPLGLLPFHEAYITGVFLLEGMIFSSALLVIHLSKKTDIKKYLFPFMAGVILFRPTFAALFGGQISGFLLFLLALVIYLWEKEKWLFGGMLLSIISLKPNLGVPIILIISFWLLLKKRFTALIGIGNTGFLLIVIGRALNSEWIMKFIEIGNNKINHIFGFSPTLWGMAAYITGFNFHSSIILGGIMAGIVGMLCFVMVWHNYQQIPPIWIVSIAITTALLITPSNWPYDQILLIIPILSLIGNRMAGKFPYLLTSLTFLFFDILAIALFIQSDRIQMEIPNVALPLIIFCALFYFTYKGKRNFVTNSIGSES